MDSKILDIITKVAKSELVKHTEEKRKRLLRIYYAGIVSHFFDAKLAGLAIDTGLSISGAKKLIIKFDAMLKDGDIACNMLMLEFMQQQGLDYMPVRRSIKRKPTQKISLGFKFSEEDELNMIHAIRQSILFMNDYGKGEHPIVNGGYFRPAQKPDKRSGRWLTIDAASWYSGIDKNVIIGKAKDGSITRRVYKVINGRTYYEYSVEDLDKLFVKKD